MLEQIVLSYHWDFHQRHLREFIFKNLRRISVSIRMEVVDWLKFRHSKILLNWKSMFINYYSLKSTKLQNKKLQNRFKHFMFTCRLCILLFIHTDKTHKLQNWFIFQTFEEWQTKKIKTEVQLNWLQYF